MSLSRSLYFARRRIRDTLFSKKSPAAWNSRDDPLEEARKLSSGDEIHGYTVRKVTEVPDFSLVAVQLEHGRTGAQHFHLAREDPNNAFGVGFRTTFMNSTGIYHILEHATLCGSRKYPVRDALFEMLSRSLYTFMNAHTEPDWTLFMFSSQNSKDFRNLLSVYLDCVFFPNLKELNFHQEGWRLEHKKRTDRGSPIVLKGVVLNETKGAFASSARIFEAEQRHRLMPGYSYSGSIGGMPQDMFNLTWKDLKEFHSWHYHPSNARFFTYGDMPLPDHLQYIDGEVCSWFSASSPSPEAPLEKRWPEPQEHRIHCPPDPMAVDPLKQCSISISYLLGLTTESYESFVDSVVCRLLVDGVTSPFYQALVAANIGTDFSPGTGYHNATKESSLSVGLRGLKEKDLSSVKKIIQNTFESVVRKGFSSERVNTILHQIELDIKHQSSKFGIDLLMSLISPWIHGAEPSTVLQINHNVKRFKEELQANPKFLQERVQQCFLDNSHRLTLIMTPNDQYESQSKAVEEARLKTMVDSLSKRDRKRVYERGLQLESAQNRSGDATCLPSVGISDVERDVRCTELKNEHIKGLTVQCCSQPTNGVTYFKALGGGIQELHKELRPYLPLFCHVITRMGARDLDYHQFAEQCNLYTSSSMSVSMRVSGHHSDPKLLEQAVLFSSHCLDRHLYDMLSLWEDIFTKPNLRDRERLRTVVATATSDLATTVSSSGHIYATIAASASLNPAAHLTEYYTGLSHIKFLRDTAEKPDLDALLKHLSSIAVHVLDTGYMRCSVNATPEHMPTVVQAMEGFLATLPGSGTNSASFMEESSRQPSSQSVYYHIPFPVNYVSRAYSTVPFTHSDSAPLLVLCWLLSRRYLHREVREKGGAYGAGAKLGDQLLAFFSYRDPNDVETLARFDESIAWASSGGFTEDDVEEAKISVLSRLDQPVAPGLQGSFTFLHGLMDELRQEHRRQLFAVTKDDIVMVTQRYLRDASVCGSAIIGPNGDKAPTDWTVHKFSL